MIALAHLMKHLESFQLSEVFLKTEFFMSFMNRSHMLVSGNSLHNLEVRPLFPCVESLNFPAMYPDFPQPNGFHRDRITCLGIKQNKNQVWLAHAEILDWPTFGR